MTERFAICSTGSRGESRWQAFLRRTTARTGLTLSARDVSRGRAIAKNGRDTHPPHHYRLEDYGVTAEEVARAFKSYHDRWVR